MILCGNCHKKHETVSDVRQCHATTIITNDETSGDTLPTEKQWVYYRDLCRQLGKTVPKDEERKLFTNSSIKPIIRSLVDERASNPPKPSEDLPDVPEGRYATPSLTGNNDYDFWKVDRPTSGKWDGFTFIKRVIGGQPDAQVRGKQKLAVLQAIISYGIDEAHTLFGVHLGRCWKCGRHLTDETSRALGIGPECRSKLWATRRNARTAELLATNRILPSVIRRTASCGQSFGRFAEAYGLV